VIDGVVGCINMLAEELAVHVKEQARLSLELEDRVRSRTAELEATMERYRMLVESTNVVPWEVDPALRVSYIAPQVETLVGEPPSQFIGNASLWDRIHDDDRERIRSDLMALVTSRDDRSPSHGHATFEHRLVRRDDTVVDVRSVVSAQYGAGGAMTALRGVSFDVTPQKKLESDLRQAHKLEAVGRLAAGIAHEINTPIQYVADNLAFVRGAIDSVLALYGRTRALVATADEEASRRLERDVDFVYLSDEVPKALGESVAGIAQVAEIVRAMKVFSHQESGRAQVPVDLRTAIEAVITVARSETRDVADVALEVGELPPVLAFGGALNQVLLNLVVNAAHAVADQFARTGQKGKIRVRATRDEGDVVVAVEDTGAGIPDSIRDRLFEPFFTTKSVGRGSGQGLAHARAIVVERHGGTLTFESEVGRGTTFFVRLPIAGRG
jgi:PAS domain S-box-containing protein